MSKASEECQGPSGAVKAIMMMMMMMMIIVEAFTFQEC